MNERPLTGCHRGEAHGGFVSVRCQSYDPVLCALHNDRESNLIYSI